MRCHSAPSIVGYGRIGYGPEVPGPLDELIFRATYAALTDAGMDLADVDAVVMASSDLFDGRAISTMTLTASTGSFTRSELRVCDDALAALALAVTELQSGGAQTVVVSSWSKLSDADLSSIEPLGVEPAFHRELGLTSQVVGSLRRSRTDGRALTVDPRPAPGADGAVAVVLTEAPSLPAYATVRGLGWSTGPYLRPEQEPLGPVAAAVRGAVSDARVDLEEIGRLRCAGFHHVSDGRLAAELGLDHVEVVRSRPVGLDVGYAAGLFALTDALEPAASGGLDLIVAATGMGDQRGYAAVVEGGR